MLIGKRQAAARASPLLRRHHALARRLLGREDDYLRYTNDGRVPFDNNAAEREIRMDKLRIKISDCLRSMAGAQNFCAIRCYLATAVKHGIGVLDALTRAASGAAWVPGLPDRRASVRGSHGLGEPTGPMNAGSRHVLQVSAKAPEPRITSG